MLLKSFVFVLTLAIPYSWVCAESATRYYSDDLSWRINGTLQKIYFHSAGVDSKELVRKYVFLRAVEYAKKRNKTYFLMYATLVDAANDRPSRVPLAGEVYGQTSSFCYIKLLDASASGAFKVDDYLGELKIEIEKGKKDSEF